MAANIVETIQTNLGYSPLQKIDPNIQDVKENSDSRLAQAAIPAVLTALYTFTRTDDGCRAILSPNENKDWLGEIYQGKEKEAAQKIADYAGMPLVQVEQHMENIADEAIKTIKIASGENEDPENIKTYMNDQRHNILVYLPAALNMGDLLHDEALDDRTNKMEGPVSNLMHKIEDKLSGGGS